MALFKCAEYPFLAVLDPRDPGRELARFRDGYFQTDDPYVIAELSKRAHIQRVDVLDAGDSRRCSYRREYRKCGKPSCRCARGELHGPYLVAYYREGKRLKKRYLGKADAGVAGNADQQRSSEHTRSREGRGASVRI